MANSTKRKRLLDAYRFAGFRPVETVCGVFGDPLARVVRLVRRSKKTICKECGRAHAGWYDRRMRRVRDLACGNYRVFLEFEQRRVYCRNCHAVKSERLDFLADSPFYTKRFAYYVGRRCAKETVKDVAKELTFPRNFVVQG